VRPSWTWYVLPEGVEDGLARRFAGNGVILEQRSVCLLFQRRVEGTDGNNQSRRFLHFRSACCMSTMRLLSGECGRTMRELGSVFQLRRTPSVSSIWLHWSFNASKSAILGGVYAVEVFGRCLVEGNEGAHNSIVSEGLAVCVRALWRLERASSN
jgi:hypothetical protein